MDREVRCRRDLSGHSAWVCMLMLGLNSEGNESVEEGRGSPSFWSWKPEHCGGEGSVQGCVGAPILWLANELRCFRNLWVSLPAPKVSHCELTGLALADLG